MTVTALWPLLREANLMETLSAGPAGAHQVADVAALVDGTALAVDTSMWLFQAFSQPALAEYSQSGACVKVALDRIINFLRFGCLPVLVVEGTPPAAKLSKLQGRARGGGCATFRHAGRSVSRLAQALGLPVIQAAGEGEATCAALESLGAVDGSSTFDADALLFGACRLFKEIKLSTGQAKENSVEMVTMDSVRNWLGLSGSGGREALVALSLLAGGDYDAGAHRVGAKGAIRAVLHLLRQGPDPESDVGLLERLYIFLRAEPSEEEVRVAGLSKCTACGRCGHGQTYKPVGKGHGPRGCNDCGTHGAREGGSGAGGCLEMLEGATCPCEFHRTSDLRELLKVRTRATATPGFAASFPAAMAAYEDGRLLALETARGAVPAAGGRLQWLHRPDVQEVLASLQEVHLHAGWDEADSKDRLFGALVEWDIRHLAAPRALGFGGEEEYEPTMVKKEHGGERDGGWRYLVELRRKDGADDVLLGTGERASARREARAVRKTLLVNACPDLVGAFDAKQSKQAIAKHGKAAAGVSRSAGAGQAAITDLFKVSRGGFGGGRPAPPQGVGSAAKKIKSPARPAAAPATPSMGGSQKSIFEMMSSVGGGGGAARSPAGVAAVPVASGVSNLGSASGSGTGTPPAQAPHEHPLHGGGTRTARSLFAPVTAEVIDLVTPPPKPAAHVVIDLTESPGE